MDGSRDDESENIRVAMVDALMKNKEEAINLLVELENLARVLVEMQKTHAKVNAKVREVRIDKFYPGECLRLRVIRSIKVSAMQK